MKIDLHTHILPESWPDLRERYGYGGFVNLERMDPCRARMMIDGRLFREVGENAWSPAARLKDCDRDGVDVQVLSTVPVMFCYWARPEHGLDLARRLNDHLASVVAAHPSRFLGLGTVPLQDADLSIRELERCLGELKLQGVQIGTHVNGGNLDEPALFPFFEAAQSLGAAVFVHPWDMMGQDRMPRYWMPWLVGMPAESSRAICSLIFGGILERLPRLRIAFSHGGGAFPGTIGRIEHGYRVRPDLCAVNISRSPREYLKRIYVDALVHDADALRGLLKLFGEDRVAMGSDYPFPLGEAVPGALIESMADVSSRTRERLLSGTALEFLGTTAGSLAAATRSLS